MIPINLVLLISLGLATMYLLIGYAHASAISSDKLLRPGQFIGLVLRWPWKGRSAL